MRRIIIAIGATLSGIVLLFSWPTSTNQLVTSAGGDHRRLGGLRRLGGRDDVGRRSHRHV